jgi:hypothetical protein
MHDTDIPAAPVQPPTQFDSRPWPRRHPWPSALISLAIFITAMGILGSLGSHRTASTTAVPPVSTSAPAATHKATTAPATTAPATTAPATTAPATTAPATTAPATTAPPAAPAAPAMSASQAQAVTAAQDYLGLGSGFSQYGLTQQLTSSAGSGFPPADATFAITYLHPDWNAQAVEAAQGYMQLGGFSHDSLMQQLTSTSGSGFTYAQAAYAVAKVGL